jgi:outer membrane cobalamin receptor
MSTPANLLILIGPLLAPLPAGLPGPTDAAPPAPLLNLEPVVVTASREPQPWSQTPGTVSVITREEIERQRYQSVTDVLRHVPGVHVDQPGPRGSRSSIYTRGLDPNHTLVLIDGVRVNDPTNNRGGSFDLSGLDPAGVERIEVVRGPLSAVHGSDAIAGAVNIVTRTGREGDEALLDVSGGRFGTYRVRGEAGGRRGRADLSVAGAWVDEGDVHGWSDFRGGNLKAALGLDLPGNARLRAGLRFADTHEEAFPDDSGGPLFAEIRELEQRDGRELSAHVELTHAATEWLDTALTGSYQRHRTARDSPGVAPGDRDPFGIPSERSRDALDHGALALRTTVAFAESLTLSAGGDVSWDHGSSAGELFPDESFAEPTGYQLDRLVGGPFVEGRWTCACGLSLQAGLRADFSDEERSELSPRVSASYRLPVVGGVLKGSYGHGFKLPSFFALASPVVGNPGLEPERSRGFDVGLSRSFWGERVQARATYFRIDVENLIDFEAGPPPRLVNRSEVLSHGVELELALRPHVSIELRGNLTHTATDVRGSRAELLNRPRWRADLVALWLPREDVTLRAATLFVGDVRDSSVPTGPRRLDSWIRVDVSALWRLREWLTLYLQIDNLLVARYQEAIGFPAVGIRPRLGAELRL